jgi:hypothetical protein
VTVTQTEIETIRVLKAMQTQAIAQRETLRGLRTKAATPVRVDGDLVEQLDDAIITADNHISALDHVIVRVGKKPEGGQS